MTDKSTYKPRLKIKRLQLRNHRTREPVQQLEPQVFAQDIDREKQIIKACMDPDFADELDKIISHLSPHHFYQDTHQNIFRSIAKIRREGKFPEFLHIGEDLQRRGVANVEILKELDRIKEFVEAHIVNVDDYIKAIQDAFGKRKCAELANNLWKMSADRKSTTGDLVEVARQSIAVIENTGAESIQRFEFIKAADLIDYIDPAQWAINGILEEKSFYYNYGPSGTYKTFVEMDRGLCIAAGIDYHGHAVKQGTVFYIAGEGQRGIYKRVLAWCIKHKIKIEEVPFYVGTFPAQLTVRESMEEIRRLIETMTTKSGDPALIIFDTLARNFGPGSENDTQDMNAAIHNLDVFRDCLCRSLIAHTGHRNRDRAKGSSSLDQAADTAFRMKLKADGRILVECTKMKDGPKAEPMLFSTETILLEIAGRDVDSLVLNLDSEGAELAETCSLGDGDKDPMGGQMQVAFSILYDMYQTQERELKLKCGDSEIVPRVSKKAWIERCMSANVWTGKRNNVARGINTMIKKEHVIFSSMSGCVYTPEIMDKYDVD